MSVAERDDATARAVTRMPLVWVAVAASVGILIDRFSSTALMGWLLVGLLAALASLVFVRRCSVGAPWFVLCAVVAVFGAWHHCCWELFSADEIGLRATDRGSPICLRGVVVEHVSEIVARPNSLSTIPASDETHCRVRLQAVRDGSLWRRATGTCVVVIKSWSVGLLPGDQIELVGRLRRPRAAASPGSRSPFATARAHRTLCQLVANHAECVSVLQPANACHPRWWLARYRMRCTQRLFQFLGREHGELAAAILLGNREYLDRDRVDAFFLTGTVHLLAISGLHVGILAYGFFLLARLSLVPQNTALLLIMLLCVIYAALTGGRAPVMRASVLVLLICSQMIVHRRPVSFNTLALAALVVLSWNPTQLFQPGAQLSFLAVSGLALAAPALTVSTQSADPIRRLKQRHRWWFECVLSWFWLRLYTVSVASLVIWFVTLPLVMYRFHVVTPSAIFLNLCLWLPVAASLFLGFGVIAFGDWCSPLAELCARAAATCLSGMEALVQWAQSWDVSHFWTAGPSQLGVCVFYLVMVLIVSVPAARRRWVASISVASLTFLAATMFSRSADEPDQLRCSFLSLGYGTSVVLEFPGGSVWLYDAGCLGSPAASVEEISSFLWQRRITKLNGIVISHADADHYNAVPGILDRFAVDVVCLSPGMLAGRASQPAELWNTLNTAGCSVRTLEAGNHFQPTPHVGVTVLHPHPGITHENDNANSIVLMVEYQGRRLLLPGDLERDGMLELLDSTPLDCDVVLAPHHGSQYSFPDQFCEWCQPEWIVICGGQVHRADEIKTRFRKTRAQVLHTALDGLVEASISDAQLLVTTWKAEL